MEDDRLKIILNWANMPYVKMRLQLPDQLQKMVDEKKIVVAKKTVLDMYCLAVLAEKLKKGDISLLEQLVGKAGIRPPKADEDKMKNIFPDQEKISEKYRKDMN